MSSNAAVKIPPDPKPPAPAPASDYSAIELIAPLRNCTPRDRRGQMVVTLRAIEGVVFKDHEHGVEVTGAATWKGIVPWANIKQAVR